MRFFKKKTFFILLFVTVVLIVLASVFCVACRPVGVDRYYTSIVETALRYDIEPELIASIARVESGFDENAVSEKGAKGLMQIMPETAEYIAVKIGYKSTIDLFDSECNIELGTAYLAYLLEKFSDKYEAVCAYNAGEGRVMAWLNDKAYSKDGKTLERVPFAETRNYVERVFFYEKKYARYFD